MKNMIKKQGLLLKFQHKFNQLHSSSSVTEKVNSSNPVSVEEEIQVVEKRKDKANQQRLSLDVIKENSNPVSVEEEIQVVEKRKDKANQQRLSLDVIKEKSKIFGRGKSSSSKKTITSWQKAVNDAAFCIAQQSPERMYDRTQLKLHAEEDARKSYIFKKSSGSRTKFSNEEARPEKRPKLSINTREEEIGLCSLEIQALTGQAKEAQRKLSSAVTLKDFAMCSDLQTEYRRILVEKKKKEARLAELQIKQARHMKYMAKKKNKEEGSSKSETAAKKPFKGIQ
ncbi:hypothetical protein OS493_012270 [Desmophyllum pertusum]|uniref:Uncharacterized protein n=1 Tax=Desmophyllum pertusum TaxID=174260 RepID=A0A9W9ZQ85_9CNID|nr:hypothetical protein OS493_012270 [Desmophyllum pertusum]